MGHSQNLKKKKKSWFIDRGSFTQESNRQKPDWLGLSSSFSSLYLKRELDISLLKIFPKIGKEWNWMIIFWGLFLLFGELKNHLCFAEIRKYLLSLQFLNIEINFLLYFFVINFNILTETSLWPWVLLISNVLIILYIFSSSNQKMIILFL